MGERNQRDRHSLILEWLLVGLERGLGLQRRLCEQHVHPDRADGVQGRLRQPSPGHERVPQPCPYVADPKAP